MFPNEDFVQEIKERYPVGTRIQLDFMQIRNREMVDRADLVLCYIERQYGGAYQTVLYAKKHNKKVVNLADEVTES